MYDSTVKNDNILYSKFSLIQFMTRFLKLLTGKVWKQIDYTLRFFRYSNVCCSNIRMNTGSIHTVSIHSSIVCVCVSVFELARVV